jgi:hypothetical protein
MNESPMLLSIRNGWYGTGVERVLQSPTEVRVSQSDQAVRLFYEFYAKMMVGGEVAVCRG